jgi:hypothetical protein
MLREIDRQPDVLPAGATPRVEEYRNECLRWKKACAETAKGTVYRKRDGQPGLNPYLRIEREASAQMRRIDAAIQRELRTTQHERPARRAAAGSSHLVYRPEAQRILGNIPPRTFARLESEGILVPTKRGRPGVPSEYDLSTLVPAYIEYVKSGTGKNGDRDARARRDNAQAALHELRLAERRKELLPRDQVIREGRAFILAVRAKLLALPRRLVQAGYVAAEAQPSVAGVIGEALEEMSRWSTDLDLAAAAQEEA